MEIKTRTWEVCPPVVAVAYYLRIVHICSSETKLQVNSRVIIRG